MYENYIFSGYGYSLGEYKISNDDIYKAIKDGFFSGLDEDRIINSDKYKILKKKNPKITPFDYMAEYMMGFKDRFHIVPFPPRKKNYETANNTLGLVIEAIQKTFNTSGIHPEDIGAWFISTATPHEMAPGIAETTKSYFVKIDNTTEAVTTTSACVGFNVNIERAVSYLKTHKNVNHVLVAHTEVMSNLLLEEQDFVPFTTFGDGAGAVIISKIKSHKKEGIIDIVNNEDLAMIDFLGADRNGNLIMEPRMVKARAIPNIVQTAKTLLKKTKWNENNTDLFIPHQTGNAIVHESAENLNFSLSKVFQDVQINYGNLSGASIPVSFAYLNEQKKLKTGMKILTSVTGLGGEMGGFTYIVPELKTHKRKNNELAKKVALVTGATGGLGAEVSKQLAEKGCRVIMQYNSNKTKAEELLQSLDNKHLNHLIIKADFNKQKDIDNLTSTIKENIFKLNYLIHTVAVTGSLNKASEITDEEMHFVDTINYKNPKKITESLTKIISEVVLFTGSIAQDAQFGGSSAYVSSKRALFGFATSYAQQNYPNIRCVYYIPGIIDGGMTNVLNKTQINMSMQAVGQEKLIPLKDIANRIVRSMYILKQPNVRNSYNDVLVIIKDGYNKY